MPGRSSVVANGLAGAAAAAGACGVSNSLVSLLACTSLGTCAAHVVWRPWLSVAGGSRLYRQGGGTVATLGPWRAL